MSHMSLMEISLTLIAGWRAKSHSEILFENYLNLDFTIPLFFKYPEKTYLLTLDFSSVSGNSGFPSLSCK